jgi:hypothetical protein
MVSVSLLQTLRYSHNDREATLAATGLLFDRKSLNKSTAMS